MSDSSDHMPKLDYTLTVNGLPPRQLDALVRSHGWRYLKPFIPKEDGFTYTLYVRENTAATLQVTAEGDALLCRTDTDLGPTDRAYVEACLARMLALDFPMKEFRARCRERDDTARLELANRGWGRLLRAATPWEDAVKILCTTNVTWTNTVRMVENLVGIAGRRSPTGYRPFPSPEDVLHATRNVTAANLKLGYRTEALALLARNALGDNPWLLDPKPPDMDEKKLYKRILAFRGFGPYAAQHLMLMMNYYSYLPIDSGVAKFLENDDRKHRGGPFADWGEFRFPAYLLATQLKNPREP